MSLRLLAAEKTDSSVVSGSKKTLEKDGWSVLDEFQLKPGYILAQVRAISARVNQNYDGWPSEELKKSYRTFIGKPVFVNHENHDPSKARGVVVAARYVENGMDKYVETVMEIDAGRFPKLAHEIKTGGLDSVSMGAEAGFTICSYCHNKATDVPDMCDHVRNHKGKTLTRFDKRTGKKEDVLVFESCHKISFFELSFVFEPADETAVASKVVVAGLNKKANGQSEYWGLHHSQDGLIDTARTRAEAEAKLREIADAHERGEAVDNPDFISIVPPSTNKMRSEVEKGWDPDKDPFDPREFGASRRTADGDITVPAPPGTPTIPQSVIDNTPVINLNPATELTGHEALGVPKQGAFAADIAEITKLAGSYVPKPGENPDFDNHFADFQKWMHNEYQLSPERVEAIAQNSHPGGKYEQHGNINEYIQEFKNDPRIRGASVHKHAGDCPPGMDCSRNMGGANGLEQIGKDTPNNPVNQVSYDPASLGQPGSGSAGGAGGGYQGSGQAGRDGLNPGAQSAYDEIAKNFPGLEMGGYNPVVDQPWDEHATGDAFDVMTSDLAQGNSIRDRALQNPSTKHIIWQQKLWYPGGGVEDMPDRGSPTENHYDHVHINMGGGGGGPAPAAAPAPVAAPKATGVQQTTRAAGKYTKEDFANAGDKKPWETGGGTTRNPVDEEDLREIEAMRLAFPAQEQDLRPNARHTTALNTEKTYLKAHEVMDAAGAPDGPRLDVGSGKVGVILAEKLNHTTYEPFPHDDFQPDHKTFGRKLTNSFGRVTNLNVLNVLPPKERRAAIRNIGRSMHPGAHAVITVRKWKGDVENSKPHPDYLDSQPDPAADPNSVITGGAADPRYQHGYSDHQELIDELHGVWGDGYDIVPVKGKFSSIGVHVVKRAPGVTSSRVRSAALKKLARSRARKLAWGEKEAPMAVDTLREEGSAPEDDNDDDQRYVDPAGDDFAHNIPSPAELSDPDLSEAAQIDREQEMSGQDTTGIPGPAEGGPAPEEQGNFITLKIPMPGPAPQVPQQAGPPVAAPPPVAPPQDPAAAMPPQQQPITAALLDYFDGYYGRRVANWLDAVEAGREMTPAEAADYRRQAARLSTLENGRELSTTNRNPRKGTANMARTSIANRNKVATAGRRQHFAEGPFVDGGERGRNDQGEQEEAFISQTPPPVAGEYPDEDTHDIPNTENNLVARVQKGRAQLLRDAQQLAKLRQRRAFDEAGGPTAEVVDPRVNTGAEGEKLTGDDFISADPNDGVVPTNPKDASLRAFQAFDGWLSAKTGKSSRRHTEATIKKAAAQFSREAGISPQALFPALGIVLREARKNNKPNTKGAKMRKRADEKLDVAAPDGRIDVEAPVENVTSAEAQASQFDLHDFGNNAGDNVADPDLSTDQNWAPGEASKTGARVKTAGGLLAMRCAEGMIAAGLEPNSRERKYQLAAEFERMNRGLIQDRVALLERFAAVRQADLRKVASGMSRGAARSPIPAGMGGGTRTASAPMQRMAAHDPRNDSSLFI